MCLEHIEVPYSFSCVLSNCLCRLHETYAHALYSHGHLTCPQCRRSTYPPELRSSEESLGNALSVAMTEVIALRSDMCVMREETERYAREALAQMRREDAVWKSEKFKERTRTA